MLIPEWFWPALATGLVTGAIQGLLVFGGLTVKIAWIFQRLSALEEAHRDALEKVHGRIDRALERRRQDD